MANLNTPFGFRPVKHLNGNPYNGASMKCYVNSTDASAMYIGDPVVWTGTACANGCCPDMNIATAGSGYAWTGSIVGVEPSTASSLIYRAAETERYLQVAVDPDLIFEAQMDASSSVAVVCNNSNLVSGTGSTITGLSGFQMDADTGDVNSQLLILGFVDREDNDIGSAYGKWLVLNSNHSFRAVVQAGV